jgi:hypothetical protein
MPLVGYVSAIGSPVYLETEQLGYVGCGLANGVVVVSRVVKSGQVASKIAKVVLRGQIGLNRRGGVGAAGRDEGVDGVGYIDGLAAGCAVVELAGAEGDKLVGAELGIEGERDGTSLAWLEFAPVTKATSANYINRSSGQGLGVTGVV